jgi:hypothetical protein
MNRNAMKRTLPFLLAVAVIALSAVTAHAQPDASCASDTILNMMLR